MQGSLTATASYFSYNSSTSLIVFHRLFIRLLQYLVNFLNDTVCSRYRTSIEIIHIGKVFTERRNARK